MATIRVTITAANVTDNYGRPLTVGTTYTFDEDFAKSLIFAARASDTDGIFSTTSVQKGAQDPMQRQSTMPEAFTASRTLTKLDNGKSLKSPVAATTLTVPTGLPSDFSVMVQQSDAGQVTFAAATGVTINNVSSQTKTSGQYAVCSLVRDDPTAEIYVLAGSTGA